MGWLPHLPLCLPPRLQCSWDCDCMAKMRPSQLQPINLLNGETGRHLPALSQALASCCSGPRSASPLSRLGPLPARSTHFAMLYLSSPASWGFLAQPGTRLGIGKTSEAVLTKSLTAIPAAPSGYCNAQSENVYCDGYVSGSLLARGLDWSILQQTCVRWSRLSQSLQPGSRLLTRLPEGIIWDHPWWSVLHWKFLLYVWSPPWLTDLLCV